MRQLLTGLVLLTTIGTKAQYPSSPIMGWKIQENSGHYTFTPSALFGTPNFHYDVYPPESATGDIGAWLAARAEQDARTAGYTPVPGQTKSQDVKSFRIYSVIVKDAAGRSWLLNYMAYTRPDHQVRYGRITEIPNAVTTRTNTNTAVQHFIKLSKQEGGLTAAPGDNPAQTSAQTSSQTSTQTSGHTPATTSHSTETPVTAPGQGLKPSDIKGVVLHQEYGMGVGGMMIIEYNPYLLLKDGTVYSHPYVCAYDLDVARSRELEPKKWGTWTAENAETLIVTFSGDRKPDRWEKAHWFWATPAAKDLKISGTWSTISGGGNTAFGGGSIVVSSNVLTFNDQGQFTTLSTGGGTYSGATGTVTAYSNKDGAGIYTFDGYSLQLKYNNGKLVRKNFCFYDDTKEVWVFGTSPYTPSDSGKKKR